MAKIMDPKLFFFFLLLYTHFIVSVQPTKTIRVLLPHVKGLFGHFHFFKIFKSVPLEKTLIPLCLSEMDSYESQFHFQN